MKKRIMAVMLSVFLLTGSIPVTAAEENTEEIEMSDASETDYTEAADGSTEEDTSAGNTENTDDTQQNTDGNTEEKSQEEPEQEADCADDTADQTEILEQTEDAVEIVPEDETESGDSPEDIFTQESSDSAETDDWIGQMKFGSSGFGSTALEYPVVPAFSPEIHEYTLYFPDDMKGIYGLVTSVFPGKVMAYFKDCKGNDESVCLNAYEKYGNYAAMDYVVDYGPDGNTIRIHTYQGTKDYYIHVKRVPTLGELRALYKGSEYVFYNHERESLYSKAGVNFQKEYDVNLPGNTEGETLSILPVTYYYKYAADRKIYKVEINGVETPTDEYYDYTLKGGEEDIQIRLSYEGLEDTVYTIHVHPVEKQVSMYFVSDTEGTDGSFFVKLYDKYGAEIKADAENPLEFTQLLDQNDYTYTAYAQGYKTVSGKFTASEENSETRISFQEKAAGRYLEKLGVYLRSYSGTSGDTKELVRHSELDDIYGGTVYTVDYSDQYSSDYSFFVSVKLSAFAPENSTAVVDTVSMDGIHTEKKLMLSTEKAELRNDMPCKFFESDENGAKRGICTIRVGNGSDTEVYKIIVNRVLELKALACSDSSDGDSVYNEKRFVRTRHDYTVSVSDNVKSLYIKPELYAESASTITINGETCASEQEVEVPIQDGVTEIQIRLSKDETYNDPELAGISYTSEGVYTIRVTRSQVSDVTFHVDPPEAAVSVYDPNGKRIYSALDHPNVFTGLKGGIAYSYTASCYGFLTESGTFTAEPGGEINVKLTRSDTRYPELENNEWWNYRNNEENNGVTSVSTPNNAKETSEKWSLQLGGSWNESCTPPLILGGYLYTGAGKYIYKLDKETGKILMVSDQLKGSLVFALNPLTYAEGMIFAQIGNGQIQAINVTTMKSLWVSEVVGGQTLSPVTYKDGYLYTGTWNSENKEGTYFCLTVTDEDPESPTETKKCVWKYSHTGGFYWAGSYATSNYVVFGSDDGSREGDYTASSVLYSVSARTGILIDQMEGLQGDIRTSVVYSNGYIYFATKGGMLYRVKMNDDGTFGDVVTYGLGGMATASPVVYKGRIYIGVCGTGGQFNEDAGHHFDVLQEDSEGISLAYSVPMKGYPQAGATLSTAYENEDYNGDGKPDGRVYLYFTYNIPPGGIYFLSDEPGQTEGKAEDLFVPEKKQQQYCISTICADSDGTLYYKNDSGYLMAISSNSAYLDDIDVTCKEGKIKWDDDFLSSKGSYTLTVPDSTREVNIKLTVPKDRSATVNGQNYTGNCTVKLNDKGEGEIQVVVMYRQQKRTYKIKVLGLGSNADLSSLVISDNNSVNVTAAYLSYSPDFQADHTQYTSSVYTGEKKFLNIYAAASGIYSKIEAEAGDGVRRILTFKGAAGAGNRTRFAVYFEDGQSCAEVTLKVTAGDGVTTREYHVSLLRTDIYGPVLSSAKIWRTDEQTGVLTFRSNESGYYYCMVTDPGAEVPQFDLNSSGIEMQKGANSYTLKDIGSGEKEVYILAKDMQGNIMEAPLKLKLQGYKKINIHFKIQPANAVIQVKDDGGADIKVKNGDCTVTAGNHYTVSVSCEGYYSKNMEFTAEEGTDHYEISLESSRSSNALLKNLYVSSSDKYGKGILKLKPAFQSDQINYEAVYDRERDHLNLWLEAADSKSSIKVYALGGIKGSTVSREDESLAAEMVDGHLCCKIYFEKQVFEAAVRIMVTAEDGTEKNYFVKLFIQDTTAPVLKAVSASRISEKKASVIFKASEKGRYYYSVTDKKSVSRLDTSGKGIEGISGTNIITLNNLKKGPKFIHIIMKDDFGNFSEILTVSIPDSRKTASVDNKTQEAGSGGKNPGGPEGNQSSEYIRGQKDSVEEGDGILKKMNKTSSKETKTTDSTQGDSVAEKSEEAAKKEGKKGEKDRNKKNGKSKKIKKGSSDEKSAEKKKEENGGSTAGQTESRKHMRKNGGFKALPTKIKAASFISVIGVVYLLFWIRGCMVNRRKTEWKKKRRKKNPEKKGK